MNVQERFADLWTDYLEGDLDEAGIAALRELLATDESLLKLAVDMYQTHHLLGLVVEASPDRHDKFVRETMARLPEASESFIGSVMAGIAPSASDSKILDSSRDDRSTRVATESGFRSPAVSVGVLTVVALAFLAVGAYIYLPAGSATVTRALPPNNKPMLESNARFASLAHAEFFGELLPPIGSIPILERDYVLMSGMVEVEFPAGASAIVEGPAVFRVLDDASLALDVGRCSVHAPQGAEGFRVETPVTRVIDRGTRFAINVSETSETEVQVVEGAADVYESLSELERDTDKSAHEIRLTDGEARKFANVQVFAVDRISFDPRAYRNRLPDRVIGYQAEQANDGTVSALQSVTVQRGGRVQTLPVSEMIGVKVVHFRAGENNANVAVPVGYDGDRLSGLEADRLLHTGVLNPGGAVEPLGNDPVMMLDPGPNDSDATPGMAVRFEQAIFNGPGPDVLFFELQTVVNPPNGDAFHVSPLRFEGNLRSHTIHKYDITMTSREAQPLPQFDLLFYREPATTLNALMSGVVERRPQTLQFRALAVGIDLSDLGYPDGALVDGLFFQDALDDQHVVDPVFIAGLPFDEFQDSQK